MHKGTGRPRHRYQRYAGGWYCHICGKKQEKFDTYVWSEPKP